MNKTNEWQNFRNIMKQKAEQKGMKVAFAACQERNLIHSDIEAARKIMEMKRG